MKDFKLDNHPKIETGFKIPETYFDDFSEKMMLQIAENEPKVISIFAKRKTWIYAVAAILVIALTIPVVNQFYSSNSDLDITTIENYLANQTVVSNDELAELLTNDDIESLKVDLNIEDKAIEDILSTNSNLEEYLIN